MGRFFFEGKKESWGGGAGKGGAGGGGSIAAWERSVGQGGDVGGMGSCHAAGMCLLPGSVVGGGTHGTRVLC